MCSIVIELTSQSNYGILKLILPVLLPSYLYKMFLYSFRIILMNSPTCVHVSLMTMIGKGSLLDYRIVLVHCVRINTFEFES